MATKKTTTKKENTNKGNNFNFSVEVNKVLNLMINSLYTNKDVALRELISNAADACDKVRYLSRSDSEIMTDEETLKIQISVDDKKKILTIMDNGVGMNQEDLIENLGTIAKSGTESFLKQFSESNDTEKNMELIGQFGVGFYSAFMIADEVEVISRKIGEDKIYSWKSKGDGEFTVEELQDYKAPRGTKIIVHLKKGEDKFLDKHHIKYVVQTYSDHISAPIEFVDDNDNAESLNTASALWTKPKSEVTEEEYKKFYKHVSHLPHDPFLTLHNRVEGVIEFTNLLFIPNMRPYNLFHPDRRSCVKLYVKKVFITDEVDDLIPAYLRFLQGVVDSEDLPLNISRETLQHNVIIEKIKKSVVNRVLDELKRLTANDKEKYKTFWENFGQVIKEGLCEATPHKDKLLDISRFYTSKYPSELVSLDEYIERMPEGQNEIYYLSGDSVDKIKNSPQLEGFVSRGIEVIFLTDTVDDFWVTVTNSYKDKELKSITRSDVDLNKISKKEEKSSNSKDEKSEDKRKDDADNSKDLDGLITFIKGTLGILVKDVRISKKLTNSPVCLAVEAGSMDMRLEKYLIEQKQLAGSSAKILEINPNHQIIQYLKENLTHESKLGEVKEAIQTLFDQACILEGEKLENPADFATRLNKLLSKSF